MAGERAEKWSMASVSAEPGEVPDPEIRMVVIRVVGNTRVCHCCCVSSQWLKTSSIVSDFVGWELEQDLTVWFI